MNAFSKMHPISKAVFFTALFVLTLAASNPVFSVISLCCAMLCIAFGGGRVFFDALKWSTLVIAAVGLFNLLFAHYGTEVLFTVKGVEFTLQALVYGLNQGAVMMAVLLWFRVMGDCMSSAETAGLLRFAPKLSLLFMLVLGFLPRYRVRLEAIRDAQRGLCVREEQTKKERFFAALQALSSLVSYSLESSIITAQSMQARGFQPKKVAPLRERFKPRDALFTAFVLIACGGVLYALLSKQILFIFEPRTYFAANSLPLTLLFAALALLPCVIEMKEVLLWKLSSVKG